jgi:lysophospholipase L1-like esterase
MSATRRDFLAASAAALAVTPHWDGLVSRVADRPILLFQGDSITDVGRDRKVSGANNAAALGDGYPMLLAAQLRANRPLVNLDVFNRGVSGNTVDDLTARWDADTLALHPDTLSILIGVNDIWHTIMGTYQGTPEKYEAGYHALLERTRTAIPTVKLVVMEPFVLRAGAVSDKWFPEFDSFRAAARRVSDQAHATFVDLHDMFQKLAAKTGPAYWLADGVHPTLAGHAAIARQWQERVKL